MSDQTVDQPAAEREPDPITPGWTTTPAGFQVPADLDDDPRLWTGEPHPERLPAACQESCCAGRAIPWPDALNPHLVAKAEPEPERRTVSLEVLTAALVAEEDARRRINAAEEGVSVELLPADAKVGVVLRVDELLAAIVETDSDWDRTYRSAPEMLQRLMTSLCTWASGGLTGSSAGEAVMPTPDALAALDGRPGAGFWTAPVPVTARYVEEGWLVVSYSGPGTEERIEAARKDCGDPDACPWPGDCTQLTIGDGKPQHFADWTTLTVRIPAAVTR